MKTGAADAAPAKVLCRQIKGQKMMNKASIKAVFDKNGMYIFLIFLLVLASVISPAFLRPQNLRDVLNQIAPLAMAGIGQTFVILSGNANIDLSVSSVMATAAVIVSKVSGGQDALFIPAIIIGICFGATVGLINGLLVAKLKAPPVMTTLSMMIIIDGLRLLFTGGAPSGDFPSWMRFLGTGSIFSIPTSIISLIIMTAAAYTILNKTVLGRKIYTVGGNINTARICGYNTDLIIISVYFISSTMAAIAGIYLGGWIGVVDNWVGKGYEIDSIAVVVMGGTSFEGGKGGVLGTIAGVFIIMILYNLVLILHLPESTQYIVKGCVIVFAAYFYVRRKIR